MVALGALLPKLNLLRIGDIVQGLSASADLPVVAWGSDAGGFDVETRVCVVSFGSLTVGTSMREFIWSPR